ncbi:MAG: AMP-binding protein, partial [Acidobacteria bacterium]|nr:AMP-binding protein [Acidobacteriota bacterium]
AYVIYTSGSTGEPKGVALAHRPLSIYIREVSKLFRMTADDRVLQFASISFDAAVEEIYSSLIHGATLTLRNAEMLSSARVFLDTCARARISVLFLPTAYLHVLAAALETEDLTLPSSIRMVVFGGERALQDRIEIWRRRLAPGVALLNGYGPTEATVTSTWADVSRSARPSLPSSQGVPIGAPSPCVRAFVVSRSQRLLPAGASGELYLGGCLARSYLGRPALTAESFVPDPWSGEPGARLYRTGDRARWLPSGELEFQGRLDHQVKVRGFRIELGEIEACLSELPDIRAAAVVAHGEGSDDKRLAAYCVTSAPVTPKELREALGEWLPDYMVPSAFVFLEEMPLTSGGKVNRRSLPQPDWEEGLGKAAYTPPRTPLEELIAASWSEVLGVTRVGIHDGFFELGGHSLKATQVISRIRDASGVELPLRQLFETPTVAGLAAAVEAARRSEIGRTVPPLVPVPRDGELPLSFAQERLWFLDQLEPGSAAYNIPAAFRFAGELDLAILEQVLVEVVRRHEVLRTTYSALDGRPFQVVAAPAPQPLPLVDLGSLPPAAAEAETRRLAHQEALRSFDLKRGPVLRLSLLRRADRDHVALLTIHHVASDGWSMGVLAKEVTELYGAFLEGRPSPLPELSIQYADFAAWQRGWLTGEVLAAEVEHWRRRLEGAPQLLELPVDRPRSASVGLEGGSHDVLLPPHLVDDLRGLGRRHGSTLFMTVLALFQGVLSRVTGQAKIPVGTPVAGRNRLEIEGLIGFFVNTLVLSTDLRGEGAEEPAFSRLLEEVRDGVLDAYDHQDLPFEVLVEALEPERSLSHSPLFQVMLVLQNLPQEARQLTGLEISSWEAPGLGLAKFDLELSLAGSEEGIDGRLIYRRDLFDPSTIERLADQLQLLAETVTADPELRLGEISLLRPAERSQILVEWNDTALGELPEATIH